jgi:hypothetical protein
VDAEIPDHRGEGVRPCAKVIRDVISLVAPVVPVSAGGTETDGMSVDEESVAVVS